MQLGIVAHAIHTDAETGQEIVQMGLIDYKAHTQNHEQVLIGWSRDKTANAFDNPVLVRVSAETETMDSTGRVLQALARIRKDKPANFSDPCNLLHILQKQLGRHVVWDHRRKEWVKVASLKQESEGRRWQADELGVIVEAESEEAAVAKIIRRLSEKAAQDTEAATALSQFILKRAVTELDGVEGQAPEYEELSVFSRRNAKKTKKAKEETASEE